MAEMDQQGGNVRSNLNSDNVPSNGENESSSRQAASSPAPASLTNESTHQNSGTSSSLNGANSGLSSEHRRNLLAQAEQQKVEQLRQQQIEAQKKAEALREKQREERKRRIEEARQREEARQKRAQEAKKELERQYKDHMRKLLQRNERSGSVMEQSATLPRSMHASHYSTRSTSDRPANGSGGSNAAAAGSSAGTDRMTTSFTVAFGSSAPRSICTKANEAVLRSQAAFEARLASYLNGRHSGCFLTQSSTYTSYALYVKPDLLPEDHPIRRHQASLHHPASSSSTTASPRRAISANPAIRGAKRAPPVDTTSSKPKQPPLRAASASRPPSQTTTRQSRLIERRAPAPSKRAVSAQSFARLTVSSVNKIRGAKPEASSTVSVDSAPVKRRPTTGRATVPRDRCNSYAAPTSASTNRQRAISQDQRTQITISGGLTTLSRRHKGVTAPAPGSGDTGTGVGGSRGRSKVREPLTTSATSKAPVAKQPTSVRKPVKAAHPAAQPLKAVKRVPTETEESQPSEATEEVPQVPTPPPAAQPASLDDELRDLQHHQQQPKPLQQPAVTAPPGSLADELVSAFATPPTQHHDEEVEAEDAKDEEHQHQAEEVVEEPQPVVASAVEREAEVVEKAPDPEVTTTAAAGEEQVKEVTERVEVEKDVVNGVEEETAHLETDSLENGATENDGREEPAEEVTKTNGLNEAEGRKPMPKLPFKASTTGAGEGGSLSEEEAAIYRAKMAEQRRLAKERLAEEERRRAEEERAEAERREAERQAAIEAARARAIEEARIAMEERLAREREAAERAARMEEAERQRLEKIRKVEEERAMRKKRLDSIMSRVNRSQTRGLANSDSTQSLSSNSESTGPKVFQTASGGGGSGDDGGESGRQNGFSQPTSEGAKFVSPLLQSLLGSGRLASKVDHSTAASAAPRSVISNTDSQNGDAEENSHQVAPQSTTNLSAIEAGGDASNSTPN